MERHLPARAKFTLISRPVLGLSLVIAHYSTKIYYKGKMSKEIEICT